MVKLISLDLDGTLLNTIDDLADASNWVCRVHGWPTHTVEEYKQYVGSGMAKLAERFVPEDWRTPEGTFHAYGIYNSTDWTYKDTQDKCYGPFFIALWTPPFWGIGIHGTNSPYSVPGRRSHGCMRMHNEDIVRVKQMVDKDTPITVLPDPMPENP